MGPREPILRGRLLEGSRELRGLWTDRGSGGACPGGGRKAQPQGVGSRSGAEPSGRFQVPSLLLPLPPTAFPPSSTTREIIPAPLRPGSAPAPVAGYQPRPGPVSVPNPFSTPPDPFSALFLGPGPRPIPGSRFRADFGPSPDPAPVPGSSPRSPSPGPRTLSLSRPPQSWPRPSGPAPIPGSAGNPVLDLGPALPPLQPMYVRSAWTQRNPIRHVRVHPASHLPASP